MKKKTSKKQNKKTPCKSFSFSFHPFAGRGPKPSEWIRKAESQFEKKLTYPNFEYYAFYFGENDLRIYPLVSSSNEDDIFCPVDDISHGLKLLKTKECICGLEKLHHKDSINENDSWDLFYSNVRFDVLFNYLSGDYQIRDFEEANIKQALGSCEDLNTRDIGDSDKQLLTIIRESPFCLHYPGVTNRFIQILNIARWSPVKEKRKKAGLLLQDYLLPINPGGGFRAVALPEQSYTLALELIEKLAKHISNKCRAGLKELGYGKESFNLRVIEDRKLGIKIDPYSDLMAWAEKENEWRLSSIGRDNLAILIRNHKTFKNKLIKERLACKKTLMQF